MGVDLQLVVFGIRRSRPVGRLLLGVQALFPAKWQHQKHLFADPQFVLTPPNYKSDPARENFTQTNISHKK